MKDNKKKTTTGKRFEELIGVRNGMTIVSYSDWIKNGYHGKDRSMPILITNVPYNCFWASNYKESNTKFRGKNTEYVLYWKKQYIRIECKWQEVAGTASDKWLKSLFDLWYEAPEKECLLLLDGGYITKRSKYLKWLKSLTEEPLCNRIYSNPNNVKILSYSEFNEWLVKKVKK